MTNDEKSILKSICMLSDNKETALTHIKSRFLTVSKTTFNKYWRIFGRKGFAERGKYVPDNN